MTYANRGKVGEKKVHDFLKAYSGDIAEFDYERIQDARSSQGKNATKKIADFQYWQPRDHGVIEVKETEHFYRLEKSRLTQLPMMRKRALAGGNIIVLTYHSIDKCWRSLDFDWLCECGDRASWNLMPFPTFESLNDFLPNLLEL